MNFAPFAVATTNIFPCANSTAGAQLLSEFNLRSRESVATHESVKYMIGPSYVHSQDDFKVSVLSDSLGVQLGNTVFVINEGKGVINGHFVESLAPIQIDLAVANQYLEEHHKPALKGKLKVGLRVMYSTEATMAGAMLKENAKYYEGIHVVVLPEAEFKLPTDVPGMGQEQQVTAHIWLADLSFVNGRISSRSIQQNAHKCEMLPASRISNVDEVLSGEFLKRPNLDAGKIYVYSGKVSQTGTYKPGWCAAQSALMMWDQDCELYELQEGERVEDYKNRSAEFVEDKGKVKLVIPHMQVDGGMTDTLGKTKIYKDKVLDIPVADYASGSAGTVDKSYTDHIKALGMDIRNLYHGQYGKQRAYIDVLDDITKLPEVNDTWEIGDYILVGQDNTQLAETSTSRAPSVLYVVVPGPVKKYKPVDKKPEGARLDFVEFGSDDEFDESLFGNEEEYKNFFDLGRAWDDPNRHLDEGWNYRGVVGEDYFTATRDAVIPSLASSKTEKYQWYRSSKVVKPGNRIEIATDGYSSESDTEEQSGSLHVYQADQVRNRCKLSAAIQFADTDSPVKANCYYIQYHVKGRATKNGRVAARISLNNDKDALIDFPLVPSSHKLSESDWTQICHYGFESASGVEGEEFTGLELSFKEYQNEADPKDKQDLNLYIDNVVVVLGNVDDELVTAYTKRVEAANVSPVPNILTVLRSAIRVGMLAPSTIASILQGTLNPDQISDVAKTLLEHVRDKFSKDDWLDGPSSQPEVSYDPDEILSGLPGQMTAKLKELDSLDGAGYFLESPGVCQYYAVSETGDRGYGPAVWLTGEAGFASESAIGGFLNVPETYQDGGYVRLNENGNLVLNDYALLRSGLLAYQLGEDFETTPGGAATNIQTELNEYVNQRIVFPNAKHIQTAENVNVIHVTLNLSPEETANVINVYDLDSRFNTAVYLHIRGSADGLTSVNISDCAKLRLEIEEECKCNVNIARCNLYYDAAVLSRLDYIADITLWYERFSDSDEWLQVTGRTVTQIAGPIGWNQESFSDSSSTENDIHYLYALKGLTFSSSGTIVGVDLAIKNEFTDVSEEDNEYLHVAKFRIPQANGFTYPESRLSNKIKISGHFVSVPAVTEEDTKLSIIETDFVAVTGKYAQNIGDNSLNGSISFLTKVRTLSNVSGMGYADQIAGWASGDYHIFHGEVAHESNA